MTHKNEGTQGYKIQKYIYLRIETIENLSTEYVYSRLTKYSASTAVFQPLTQVSITAATTGLTSGFGMGPGRALPLWPAYPQVLKCLI